MQLKRWLVIGGLWVVAGGWSLASAQTPPIPYQTIWNVFTQQDCQMGSPPANCTFWPTPTGAWGTYVGSGGLTDFTNYAASLSAGTGKPFLVGQLTPCNSNVGPSLLAPGTFAACQQIVLAWKAVGAQAISVEVSFPMLYAPYLDGTVGDGYQASMTAFYTSIANMIRANGLKVVVESQAMLGSGQTGGGFWPNLASFYNTLTCITGCGSASYAQARATGDANIATAMHPDYYVMMEEPDTESNQAGQPLQSIANEVAVLDAVIASVRALSNTWGMKIGAGLGPWFQQFETYVNAYTQQACGTCVNANLDFLDLHVFPIPENTQACPGSGGSTVPCNYPAFWTNYAWTFNRATTGTCSHGAGAGCDVTISQTWLRKITGNGDWPPNVDVAGCTTDSTHDCRAGDVAEAREGFGFWRPLDQQWLTTMHTFGTHYAWLWIAAFNTQNLGAALPFGTGVGTGVCNMNTGAGCNMYPDGDGVCTFPCGNIQPNPWFSTAQTVGRNNLAKAVYSTLAQNIHDIWYPPSSDTVAPSVPRQVVANRTAGATASLSWQPSTDNVGVAGYQIMRNGVLQSTATIAPPYLDTGLTPATAYSYQVRAFDLAGNYSAWTLAQLAAPIVLSGSTKLAGSSAIQ